MATTAGIDLGEVQSGVDNLATEFERLVENQIQNKVDAIIVCGTTGESSCMSLEEKKQAIKFAIDTVNR